MRKRLTKPISVLLAFVMLFTSINLMMPVVADAAASTAQINDLKNALAAAKAAGVTSPSSTSYAVTNTGTKGATIVDYTPAGYIYQVAKALYPVFYEEVVVNSDSQEPTWWRTLMQNRVKSLTGNDASYNTLIDNLLGGTYLDDWGRNNRKKRSKLESSPDNPGTVTITTTRSIEAGVIATYPTFASLPSGGASVSSNFSYWADTGRKDANTGIIDKYYWLYFSAKPSSSETPANATTLVTALRDFGSYFTSQVLSVNPYAEDWASLEELVAANTLAMQKAEAVRSSLTYAQNYNAVMNRYFNMTAINQFVADCLTARNAYRAEAYVDFYYDIPAGTFDITVDWDDIAGVMAQKERMTQLEVLMDGKSDADWNNLVRTVYPFFNIADVRAFQSAFNFNYEKTLLQWVKNNADAYLNAHYNNIDPSAPEYYTQISNAEFDIMYGNFQAYTDILKGSFAAENFNAVFGSAGGAQYITNFLALLQTNALLREYNIFHASYYRYFTNLYAEDISKLKIDDIKARHLEGAIEKRDEYFAKYQAAIAEYGQAEADAIFVGIHELDANINAHMENVKNALGVRFKAQVDVALALVPSDLNLNWHNFNAIKSAVNKIEQVIYDDYKDTNYIDLQTKQNYEWLLSNVLSQVAAFAANHVNNFVQTTYDAQYPTRVPNVDDFVRSESPAHDYTVTDTKLANIITSLEKMVMSDDLAEFLELDESIGQKLSGIVAQEIYTDKFVNSLIGMLYPLLFEEFSELLGDLPTEVEGIKIKYKKDLRQISQDLGLALYPDRLAAKVDMNKFPIAWSELSEAGQDWTNLYDEEEDLILHWGIDEVEDLIQREARFKDALAVAFDGLLNLFLTLLCNRSLSAQSKKVAEGDGILSFVDGNVFLNASGNEGYAKTFVPIYEMLGVPASQIPDRAAANNVTTARGMVDLIFNPLLYFLNNQLAVTPLQTLIDLLPNLAYALSVDLVKPTLSGLAATLNYQIEIDYKLGTYSIRDTLVIDAGEMLDLEDKGIDLSGFDGLIRSFVDDAEIPYLNAGSIATLGELQKNLPSKRPSGVRNYVKADRADVLFFLLNYLLDAVGDEAFINTLLGMLSDDEEGGNEESALSPEVLEILAGLGEAGNRGDIIAAVVELFNPTEYPMAEYDWVEPVPGYSMAYLSYSNSWTKEKADYVYNNIDAIVDSIGQMADMDEDIPTMLSSKFEELFTAENLKSLTDTLADLDLDESLVTLLKGVLGVDLSSWANYGEDYNPVINNREDFLNELYAVLAPLAPLVVFMLSGEDLVAFDGALRLTGYNGYANGLIPLMEALGCENMMAPADYLAAVQANPENAIRVILDPLFALFDKIIADPVATVLEIIPSILYFLESGGLATSVKNILQPLLALLDTVRPIYNLSIQSIIEMVAGDDEELEEGEEPDPSPFANIERLDDITLDWVFTLLEGETGLELHNILGNAIENMAKLSEPYASANGKTAYTLKLDGGDVITILISTLIELLTSEENQPVITEMLELDEGILPAVVKVINGSVVDIEQIKWFYFDDTIDYENAFANPDSVALPPRSITYLSYPNNWNAATASYLDQNLAGIVDMILGVVSPEGGTVADMLDGALDIYNDETVNSLISSLQSLTKSLDATLLELVDVTLDLDLSSWNAYDENTVWGVTDRDSFVAAMATAIAPLGTLLDWLLCGKDIAVFNNSQGGNLISITGTEGYAYGLVPIFEALGVEGMMNANDFKASDAATKVEALLGPVLARVDAILADPINELLGMIPNLIYFLNADGLTVSLNNLLGGIYNILEDVQPITGIDNLDEELGFPLSDLSLTNLLAFAEEKLGVSLAPISNFLEDFYLGEISHFVSANNEIAFRMSYSDTESRKDLITIVFSLLLQVLDYDANTDAFKEMLGEDVYAALKNVLHMGDINLEMLEIDWIYKEKAGTGEVLNAINTSELFEYGYGTMWTRERAEFVDDNINELVDNLIYLLGVKVEDKRVQSLDDLLATYLGVSLYTQENAVKLLDSVKGLVAKVDEIDGSEHLKALIKESIGIDLTAWDNMDASSFTVADNDKNAFIDAVTMILAPLTPILGWLLCDDDFAFFVDENAQDYLYLGGAEGYEYGILPILEALECEGIVAPADFDADRDNMLRNIITPILSKVDVILADPVNELLNIMPALTYFVNSNGLDVSFKNLINPIRVILTAIEPVAQIDLYDVIGFRLDDFNFETMFNQLITDLNESTGYNLTPIAMNAAAEMTSGVVVEKTSLSAMNNYTRYTMEYAGPDRADMITIVMRLLISFLTHEDNAEQIKKMLKNNLEMDDTSYGYVSALLDALVTAMKTPQGIDTSLGVVYYITLGLSVGAGELRDLYDTINGAWAAAFASLKDSDKASLVNFYNDAVRFLEKYLPDIVSPEGPMAPNGFVAFFQKIAEFFKRIGDFFRSMFGG